MIALLQGLKMKTDEGGARMFIDQTRLHTSDN
jgi:hypothetical protein